MAKNTEGLWAFALRLYGRPGVGDACLVLQDRSGVDVPVLLFSAWLSKASVPLTERDLKRVDGLVKAWRDEVTIPLRAVRRRLKASSHPAPGQPAEDLRNDVKAAELASEKIELAILEAQRATLADTAPTSTRRNISVVVRYYRGAEPDAEAGQALAVIESALSAL